MVNIVNIVNIEHIFLFTIIAYLLYHLLSGCGCNIRNGFSVGGQVHFDCPGKEAEYCWDKSGFFGDKCQNYYQVTDGFKYLCVGDTECEKSTVKCLGKNLVNVSVLKLNPKQEINNFTYKKYYTFPDINNIDHGYQYNFGSDPSQGTVSHLLPNNPINKAKIVILKILNSIGINDISIYSNTSPSIYNYHITLGATPETEYLFYDQTGADGDTGGQYQLTTGAAHPCPGCGPVTGTKKFDYNSDTPKIIYIEKISD